MSVEIPGPPAPPPGWKTHSVAEYVDLIAKAFDEARDLECDRVIAEAQARIDARKSELEGTPELAERDGRMSARKDES
ncbi:hypothetical protein DK926_18805 [Rhodococcus sp. Eu-32]|uniref:hypothetical protein n=1 Tax=Rhodococcus sp. Eu-32 TaxID=1017319 RepID=UPI000F7AC572|nr:hypothetical protein [Rhodococcus sp. Eu-32]RRQ26298.1 hypothetical protein DK926_18805 [Rhodococcus sp. Eu-32]